MMKYLIVPTNEYSQISIGTVISIPTDQYRINNMNYRGLLSNGLNECLISNI